VLNKDKKAISNISGTKSNEKPKSFELVWGKTRIYSSASMACYAAILLVKAAVPTSDGEKKEHPDY
jgi:hypothetical protein